ncbi:hypothetical protein VA7868_00234 [Vibrio aerogenes CECT 7868]|uniref:Uncharacterized protein n=2 Tax=Vibrio aerogenes TaxID=92172 RepID=A0A1M5V0J1_9VIBR|nr:hypothetical protein VA7868_00234 [Vibrio aerogenes CECT 7868]
MDVISFFISTVAGGVFYDAIKSGTLITGEWLKDQLKQQQISMPVDQPALDAWADELQNVPSYARSSPEALKEYLGSQHVRPVLEKHLKQTHIHIEGDNSGIVIGGDVYGGVHQK